MGELLLCMVTFSILHSDPDAVLQRMASPGRASDAGMMGP